MKTVSIVIPNYNGKSLLLKNLSKLFLVIKDYKNVTELIIIDDASTDDSIETIQNLIRQLGDKIQQFKIIKNDKNMGFASTINRGVRETSGEVILLLNTDAYPEKGFLEPALLHFDNEKVFAVGGMDKSVEKNKIVLRGRGIGQWSRGFLVHSRGEVDKKNTLWVSGGSSFFRKSIWEKLNGLNELYSPFYWEDIDISYRALKSGYKIIFEKKSVFVHEHESGAILTNYSSQKIKQIAFRNQFIFVWTNATDLSLQFLHLIWLPYHFTKAILRGDVAFFIGFFEAVILLPSIVLSSFKAQKLFIVNDKKVIQEFNQ